MAKFSPQTRILADILTYGEDAALTFTLRKEKGWTEEQMLRATRALHQAVTLAKDGSWDLSEQALDRAYTVLGGVNKGTGYDFYCGCHAIQRATD